MIFQLLLPACETGSAEAWRAFLAAYTPIAFRLLEVHASRLPVASHAEIWREALKMLAANGFHRLREFDHQGEREFLCDLKRLVLDLARPKIADAATPRPTLEALRLLLEGRPIAHQEVILLRLSGYAPAALEQVLAAPASLVRKVLEGAEAAQHAAPGAWLEVLQEVCAARTDACPPRRLFARIEDGQVSWYDKTPAENHMARCLHCLDVWASLREAEFLRRNVPPAAEAEIKSYLAALPLKATAQPRSFWSRLLGR
jgi:hypothetical protein